MELNNGPKRKEGHFSIFQFSQNYFFLSFKQMEGFHFEFLKKTVSPFNFESPIT